MEATLSFQSVPLHWGVWAWQRWWGPSPPQCNPLLVSPLSALSPLVCRGADRIIPVLPSLFFPNLPRLGVFFFSWLM